VGIIMLANRQNPNAQVHDKVSTQHCGCAHDPVADQADKFARAGVMPAKLHPAAVADAVTPSMAREPTVLLRRYTNLFAAKYTRENDDIKFDAIGIFECELALTVEIETVLFIGDAVQAPNA